MKETTKEQGFYGKECNYAFPSDGSYSAFFLGERGAEHEARFDDIDSCILWAAYQEFVTGNAAITYKNAVICDGSGKPVLWFNDRDRMLEYAWMTLTDVNIDEDEETEQDWFIFPKGTGREEIWHWFDERYTEGVGELMYKDLEADKDGFPLTKEDRSRIGWAIIEEDGKLDEEAARRAEAAGRLVDPEDPYPYDDDADTANLAVVIPEMEGIGGGHLITVSLSEDCHIKGLYRLETWDNEGLLGSDGPMEIKAGSLKEAISAASKLLLANARRIEKHAATLRDRYLIG